MRVKKLDTQIAAMGQTVNKLKKDRETSQKDVEKLQGDLTRAVQTIKVNPT
jgi:peptidoglycan hydrolase CwlO-like protein